MTYLRVAALAEDIVPEQANRPYDVAGIGTIFDKDSFLEVRSGFARNVVVGLLGSVVFQLVSLRIIQSCWLAFWT